MKFNNLILLGLFLLLVLLLGIGAATANENHTIDNSILDAGDNVINIAENSDVELESEEENDFEVNNDDLTANAQVEDTNVHIYAKASKNVSGSYPIVDLKYSSDNVSFYSLKDDNNNVIYPTHLYKNEVYNKTFSNLKNGYYRLSLGKDQFFFTIEIPTTYNLTIKDNTVSISVFTNEKAHYINLLYAEGTNKDKYDTWLKNQNTQLNYTLTNGEYKFRLYNTYTKEEKFIPFKIDVPLTYNVTTSYNNVTIAFNINDKFDYKLLDSNGEEIRENFRVLKTGFNQYKYTLPNGDYTFKITGPEATDIPFKIDYPTKIDAYTDGNSMTVNIDGNPLDDFKIYINDLLESWNKRNNDFYRLKNGNYAVEIYENNYLIWEKLFEIKEPNTDLYADTKYSFSYGEKCKIYVDIPLDDQETTAHPILVFNDSTVKGKETDYYDGAGTEYVFSFKKPVGKYLAEIRLDDGNYYAEPLKVTIEIKKANPVLAIKTAYSTTKSYTTLRTRVVDKTGAFLNEGVVNFTIDGKTYSVKVKNGEAIKKIKLTNPKTYTLKAEYYSTNYNTKSVSSKVIVSKAKNSYLIKIGKYSCKISFKEYIKILDAKSWNSVFYKKHDTKKTIKIKYYTYTTKKVTYTKKKLSYQSWVKNGRTYYESYGSAYIAPKGYKYAGYKTISKGSDWKEYQIYKKTVNKKIKSKPKYKSFKVYIMIDTYRWSKNHDVKARACTDSMYLRNLDKDYNYSSKEIVL